MQKKITEQVLRMLFSLFLSAAFVGCSADSPMSPVPALDKPLLGENDCPSCPQTSFSARVSYANQEHLRLAFADIADTLTVPQNCEMFRLVAGYQFRIQFGDIHLNDSVEVNGQRRANGEVLALRLRVMESDGSCGYDLAFRDSISSIDYAAATFTVYGRSELITVDQSTVIWGHLSGPRYTGLGGGTPRNNQNQENFRKDLDTLYTFTDLQPGDIVEIKANIVNESTLLATKIKIVDCNQKTCTTFEAVIAAIDPESRILTFVGLDWLASVCPKAQLVNAEGESLLLSDFPVGAQVSVKGFPDEDGTLRICVLTLVSPA